MNKALIVEQGYSRGAVAAARALAQAGWTVGVGAPGGRGLAAVSRACQARHDVPPAHEDLEGFVAAVRHAILRWDYEVVFGAGEAEVLALSQRRSELNAVVPHAGHEAVVAALDKDSMERAARAVGFSVPESVDLSSFSDEDEPLIVKASAHAHPGRPGAPPRVDTNMVLGATAGRRRVRQMEELGAQARVQKFYRGTLLAYSAVVDRSGRVVADSMQQAARIWPPGAGASCRAETVKVEPSIAGPAAALLKSLLWFGLAELQFIALREGPPRLIDLNGRFYGSLALAVAAGANLPAVWAALASGRPVEQARARPGVRYQWLEGDLRRALAERRGGFLSDLTGTLKAARGRVHSLTSASDPAPALAQVGHLGTGALRRLVERG